MRIHVNLAIACLLVAGTLILGGCQTQTQEASTPQASSAPANTSPETMSQQAVLQEAAPQVSKPQESAALETTSHELANETEPPQAKEDQAQEDPDVQSPTLPEDAEVPSELDVQKLPQPLDPPPDARRLDPEYDVWIDPERRVVILDGQVCFREGPLEMFACTRGTKEHESIVSVRTKAFLVHAALLNIGAQSGTPVKFVPEFQPPTGTEIEIRLEWEDDEGQRHSARAQDWVRDARTGEAMEHPWVFAGSSFWKDETTGRSHYQAEAGDFICVSNFASAMLDIPVESTQANEGLAFEAFTERIPPLGTYVRLTLVPDREEEESKGEAQPQ